MAQTTSGPRMRTAQLGGGGTAHRRPRSSNTTAAINQEEPLRVKNFVGANLPSPETVRWFESKVKYLEELRFHAHLADFVAQSESPVINWPDVCVRMANEYSYLKPEHPLMLLLTKDGEKLRLLYDYLCRSLRANADNLLVHRNFLKASFEERLAFTCNAKARIWANLEDTEGQRLVLKRFQDEFIKAEAMGPSSVDLAAVVEECTPFLQNYVKQGLHLRFADVAKAYITYLRWAYANFGFTFPLPDDLSVAWEAVPTPPVSVAAPDSPPPDETEAQSEPTISTAGSPVEDVDMTGAPTVHRETEMEDDQMVVPEALIPPEFDAGAKQILHVPARPEQPLQPEQNMPDLGHGTEALKSPTSVVSDRVESILELEAHVQEPAKESTPVAIDLPVDTRLPPSMPAVPFPKGGVPTTSTWLAVDVDEPLRPTTMTAAVAAAPAVTKQLPVVMPAASPPKTPPRYPILSVAELYAASASSRSPQLAIEPLSDEIPSPVPLNESPMRIPRVLPVPPSPLTTTVAATTTTFMPSRLPVLKGKPEPKKRPATLSSTITAAAAKKSKLNVVPKPPPPVIVKVLDHVVGKPPGEMASSSAAAPVTPTVYVVEEESESVVFQRDVAPKWKSVAVVKRVNPEILSQITQHLRLMSVVRIGPALRGLIGDLFSETPSDLLDFDPFKLPVTEPNYRDCILQPQSIAQLAACLCRDDKQEAARSLSLIPLNAVCFNGCTSDVANLGLEMQRICSDAIKQVVDVVEGFPNQITVPIAAARLQQETVSYMNRRGTRERPTSVRYAPFVGGQKSAAVPPKTPAPAGRTRLSGALATPPPELLPKRTRGAAKSMAPAYKSALKK